MIVRTTPVRTIQDLAPPLRSSPRFVFGTSLLIKNSKNLRSARLDRRAEALGRRTAPISSGLSPSPTPPFLSSRRLSDQEARPSRL